MGKDYRDFLAEATPLVIEETIGHIEKVDLGKRKSRILLEKFINSNFK